MKKTFILISLLLLCSTILFSQNPSYKQQPVNIKLKDIPVNKATPLGGYAAFFTAIANGYQSLLRELSSERLKPYFPESAKDIDVTEKHRDGILNKTIKEVLIYKDSVAAIVADFSPTGEEYAWFVFEEGKWVNAGQGLRDVSSDKASYFLSNAATHLSILDRIAELKELPADTSTFLNYIKTKGLSPKEYLLKTLSEKKVVICGDLHRRQVAWDFMRSVVSDPRFSEVAGTVFMELPSYRQPDLNRFYNNTVLDTEILLDIFRDEQIYGWYDRGEFEFMVEIWKINRNLPAGKKIKVMLADFQAPYSTITTPEEYAEYGREGTKRKNRDEHMADVITDHLKSSSDRRNTLFIVGYLHAYKTPETVWFDKKPSAGYVLSQRLGRENVFSIFPHVPIIANNGDIRGRMRQGLYDYLFKENGNKPVGIDVAGSPFADQPFDGITETIYSKGTGMFADNFDGYIFLQPLEDEQNEYILYDIFSDRFIDEMKRRAAISGDLDRTWHGVKVKDMTKEAVISSLKKSNENIKRW